MLYFTTTIIFLQEFFKYFTYFHHTIKLFTHFHHINTSFLKKFKLFIKICSFLLHFLLFNDILLMLKTKFAGGGVKICQEYAVYAVKENLKVIWLVTVTVKRHAPTMRMFKKLDSLKTALFLLNMFVLVA